MARKKAVMLTPEQFESLSEEANVARAAGLVTDETEPEPTPAEEDLAAAEREEENDIFATLLEIQGAREARWQVHRLLPADKAGFCLEMNSAELTLANIMHKCGAGKYRVIGMNSKGRFVGSRTIQIAPLETAIGAVPVPSASPVQDVLALMREDSSRRKDEAFKWAALIVPALAPVLGQLLGNRGPSLTELTATLNNMRQLAGGDQSQLSKVEEFARLIEIVKGIAGGESAGANWIDLARDAIKEGGPILAGVAHAIANRGPQVNPALPSPVPALASPVVPVAPRPMPAAPVVPPNQETNPMMRVLIWLQGQVPGLLQKAAKDLDPEVYAVVLLDELPAGSDAVAVRNYMARDDWWQWVIKYVPQAAPYQEWFTELRNAIISEIDAMIEEATGAGSVADPEITAADSVPINSEGGENV